MFTAGTSQNSSANLSGTASKFKSESLVEFRRGLCGDWGEHSPHIHVSESLGTYWCTANNEDRIEFRWGKS